MDQEVFIGMVAVALRSGDGGGGKVVRTRLMLWAKMIGC
jgi:hypothetical protein